ncbi:DUF4259 domain-containing protein [Dactylosporangium cerinum]|uniref:DUF4259 domain-containing protein n=1 Tax=Dactylosporangium cerinum TaxID=1434730 RepID=A0ABV9WCE5_9ACTN
MARYNTGPFDSDTAQDLLELYAELTQDERLDNLRAVFLGGPRHPDGPFEPVDNTEVVAGAALVARALPGGARIDEIPQMGFDEEVAAAAVTAPGDDLIQLALDAIRAVAADDAWFTTRLGPSDSARSRQTVAVIAGVLADHRATSG